MAVQFDNTNTGVVTIRSGTSSGSIILGGVNNTATNTNAVVDGGDGNSASGKQSFVAGGTSNIASNTDTFVGGGLQNLSNATYATVIGGKYGTNRSITSIAVFPASSNPITASSGVSQSAIFVLGRQTADATATVLIINNSGSASTTNQVIMPNNSAYYFRGECIAGVTGAGDTKGWYIEGVIKRGANAAATSIVGTASVTSLYADTGAATWAVTATADTTNGGLAITVTGAAATTIRWVCQIRTTEMTY